MQNGVCGLLAFEGEQQTLGSRTHVSVRTGKHRCALLHAWSVSEHAEGGLTTSAVRAEGAGRRSVGLCDRSRASHWSSSYSFLDFLEFGRYGCIFSSAALAALSRCMSRTVKAPVLSDRSVGLSAAARHQHDRSSEHGPPQPPCPSAGDPVPPAAPGSDSRARSGNPRTRVVTRHAHVRVELLSLGLTIYLKVTHDVTRGGSSCSMPRRARALAGRGTFGLLPARANDDESCYEHRKLVFL